MPYDSFRVPRSKDGNGGEHENNNVTLITRLLSLPSAERLEIIELLNGHKKDIIGCLEVPMLVQSILRRLDPATLCRIRLVSRTWRERASDNVLWREHCVLASFPVDHPPRSFHHDPHASDAFFQLYRHHATVERNWNRSKFSVKLIRDNHQDSITCLASPADGDTVYAGSADSSVRLWDLTTSACLLELKDHSQCVQCLALGPTLLVTGSWDKTIIVYDVSRDHSIRHRLLGHMAAIISLVMDPNETRLFSGSVDTTICIWDLGTGACLNRLYDHEGTVGALVLIPRSPLSSSDRYWLVSGSNDKVIYIWDLDSTEDEQQRSATQQPHQPRPRVYRMLQGHSRALTCLAWYKEVEQVTDGDFHKGSLEPLTINISSAGTSSAPDAANADLMDLDDLDFDGRSSSTTVASPGIDERLQQHNRFHPPHASPSASPSTTSTTAVSPTPPPLSSDESLSVDSTPARPASDSRRELTYILSSAADCTVRVWDFSTGLEVHAMNDHSDVVWDLQCSSTRLVSVSSDGNILVRPLYAEAVVAGASGAIHHAPRQHPCAPSPRSALCKAPCCVAASGHQACRPPLPATTLARVNAGVTCVKMSREWLLCGTDEGVLVALHFAH